MISTKFFPTSWTSPATVPKIILAVFSCFVFVKYSDKKSTLFFITSAEPKTKGSWIVPSPNFTPISSIVGSKISSIIAWANFFSPPNISLFVLASFKRFCISFHSPSIIASFIASLIGFFIFTFISLISFLSEKWFI